VRCRGKTRSGQSCRARVVHGSAFCVRHAEDPAIRSRALDGSRRGGLARGHALRRTTAAPFAVDDLDLETAVGLRRYLARALLQLAKLPFDVRTANAMAQMVNVARAGIEAADLEGRLAALEARVPGRVA